MEIRRKYMWNLRAHDDLNLLLLQRRTPLPRSSSSSRGPSPIMREGRRNSSSSSHSSRSSFRCGFDKELKKGEKISLLFLQHVTPVFGREPTQVICPGCQVKKILIRTGATASISIFFSPKATVKTRVSDESGLAAWLACLGLCFFG